MKLSEEQRDVVRNIIDAISKQQVVRMGGFAGTGKTTVISHLLQYLGNWAVCAYTGKAANVLRKKKLQASTIHSLIYVPLKDVNGNIVLDSSGSPIFVLATSLDYEGILVDESSMVSEEIDKDLKSFGLPIIYVGDHGQLEPVSDIKGFNLMKNPDFKLETIHRNAGPIAHFADFIRKGYRPSSYANRYSGPEIQFIPRWDANKRLTEVDQIICAYNKTRVELNGKVRAMKGFNADWPQVGDKVMCLRNNRQRAIFNGMQGTIEQLGPGKPLNKMIFRSDEKDYELYFDPATFMTEKAEISHNRDDPDPFDYAYAITAHKSQGDEWGKVMVIEQKCDLWDHKRWAYTAASRAKEKLIWVGQ
jgi:exodeoxyribonuclease-5